MDNRVGIPDGSDQILEFPAVAHLYLEVGMTEHVVKRIVSIDEAIHHADFSSGRKQFPNEAGADIAGTSQDQHRSIGRGPAHNGRRFRFQPFLQGAFGHAWEGQGKYG